MIGLLAVCLLAMGAGTDDPYRWPLDLPRVLTSSFAEYRPSRFHAGIDLRTGPTPQLVYAADDGYVSRLRCSPWGYGKAVYLTLRDGNMAIYAHLSAFEGELAQYVRQAQHAKQSYSVDLTPEPRQFPIAKGQLIARSGHTGIGAPHLHYELRDPANRPINPRALNISWLDNTRPVLRKLLVAPDGPGSTVNGGLAPVVLTLKQTGPGEYEAPTITASGRIGFGADLHDPVEGGARLGIYSLAYAEHGGEVFRVQHDRLSYDTMKNGAVAYHPAFLSEGQFLLLWRWPGNVCDSYAVSSADGWFEMTDEPTAVEIEAIDFLGNSAKVGVFINPEDEAPPGIPAGPANGRGRITAEGMGDWLLITANFSAPEPEPPRLAIEGPAALADGEFRRIDAKSFQAAYRPGKAVTGFTLRAEHPRAKPYVRQMSVFHRGGAARQAQFGAVTARATANTPYGALIIACEELATAPSSPIPGRGTAYRFWPETSPIDAPLEISLPAPADVEQPARAHIYLHNGSSWSRLDTRREGGRYTVSASKLGVFRVLEDTRPPRVVITAPAADTPITSRRPEIAAEVSDTGSGIVEVTMTCGGQWLLAEYDPEDNRVVWAQDEDLPAGDAELAVRATDAAGNSVEKTRALRIPE